MAEPPRDTVLLAACRAGDAAAWDTLIRRYERLVYTVAVRNGLDVEDAADVCQSTFVALLEACDRLRDDERLASWLMTVARRQSWRLRRQREHERPVESLPEVSDDPPFGWDQVADLHTAFNRISEPCRSLLFALYFDPNQPPYAAIARDLGRSIGGIGPLRGRCLQRMRRLMEEDALL
jgi:RNA polymerase sigma factor (sigma-70 family)